MAFKALLSWPQPTSPLSLCQGSLNTLLASSVCLGEGEGKLWGLWVRAMPLFRERAGWRPQQGGPFAGTQASGTHWVLAEGMRYCEVHPGTWGPGRGAMGFYTRPCYTWTWEGPAKNGVRLLWVFWGPCALPPPSPQPTPLPRSTAFIYPRPTITSAFLCLPQALTDVPQEPPTSVAQEPA